MSAQAQRPGPPDQVIAAQIRARIVSGDLRPGDRVPSIRQIAERWGGRGRDRDGRMDPRPPAMTTARTWNRLGRLRRRPRRGSVGMRTLDAASRP
ncbi:GntR family transcriptional regulator [Nocardia fusca]|uniref:GntR family transcriptional regulator n=1 Tax=Nocardia fusca TaxID=941183 RepID=UPI000A005E5C